MKPDYCTQNNGDCPSCSLSSYGRDCQNNRIITLEILTRALMTNESMARKLLNDSGGEFDELADNPGEVIPRDVLISLATLRAGDRIGAKAAELLR